MRGIIAIPLSSFAPSLDMSQEISTLPAALPENSTPSTPPRAVSTTAPAVHSTPNSNHISSQTPEQYTANHNVRPQHEWLREDLKSTVLISAEDFNDLVFDAKDRVATLECENENFRSFIQNFLKNKDYVEAKEAYLAECKTIRKEDAKKDAAALEKPLYEPFAKLCNVIIARLGVFPGDEAPKAKDRILFYRQDPKKVRGSLTHRIVDLGVLGKEGRSVPNLKPEQVCWDLLAHWNEMKRLQGHALARRADVPFCLVKDVEKQDTTTTPSENPSDTQATASGSTTRVQSGTTQGRSNAGSSTSGPTTRAQSGTTRAQSNIGSLASGPTTRAQSGTTRVRSNIGASASASGPTTRAQSGTTRVQSNAVSSASGPTTRARSGTTRVQSNTGAQTSTQGRFSSDVSFAQQLMPSTGPATGSTSVTRKRGREVNVLSANKRMKSSEIGGSTTPNVNLEADDEPEKDEVTKAEAAKAKTQPAQLREDVQLQNAGYALEMLSSGLLRSHAIGMLVDTTEVQLGYFDHSVILLSAPFSVETHELHFIETMYHLRGLSSKARGIVPLLQRSTAKRPAPAFQPLATLYSGSKLTLGSQSLVLGKMVYNARSIIGRGTIVVEASDKASKVNNYVVKLSFPSADRNSEGGLLWLALNTAKKDEKWKWVENHLPTLRYWSDTELTVEDDYPHQRIKAFLDEHCPNFGYESRVLRLLCQEKLDPLTSLRDQVQYAQAFCDILQAHRWLYDHPRILHRDISMQNIMVRRVGDKTYGVLNDLDLASELTKRQGASSKHRTGTRPFMARELLRPGSSGTRHLYRHDLESIFYVMLCLCSRYNLDGKEITKEYEMWYTERDILVAALKHTLITADLTDWEPNVTGAFIHFYQILLEIRKLFRSMHLRKGIADDEGVAFDAETGNGAVTYEKFLNILKTFNGQQLDVYYPTPATISPLSTTVEEEDFTTMEEMMDQWLDDESHLASEASEQGKGKGKGKAKA
ncbi:hypothetical protein VKT23_011480 [Stygiomarasmius scandens]|uniref:Protein kinase domain-containing protein n=1 Tax=Marasmiellus scandens TaxID=2682957 RepID=A0ABR1J8E5_9AGAR